MKTTKEQRKKLRHTYGGFSEEHNVFLDLLDDLDTQETELTKLRKRVDVLESALKVLCVAVNDKQPDPGAVAFIDKALTESAKIAESKEVRE